MEQRYIIRDWEPATLDGGQFTEAATRLIYHQDSGNLNRRKSVNKCVEYVEDPNGNDSHSFPDRKSALHLLKPLRTIYKFRSARGAVHIDPDYTANHIDAKLVLENARWILSEILRIFWTGDNSKVAKTIQQLIEFEIPVIGKYEDTLLVQRTDLTTEEEILILLYHRGEVGFSRTDLGNFVSKSKSSISIALKKLCSSSSKQVIKLGSGNYRLTDLGIYRVLNDLSNKFILQ